MAAAGTSGRGARVRTPVHLWVVGVLALLWNAMGAFDYLATQFKLEFYVKQFTPEQLSYFYGFPAWAVAGWAFGVWGPSQARSGCCSEKCGRCGLRGVPCRDGRQLGLHLRLSRA